MIDKQPNKTIMGKSKFKTVIFKPFDVPMEIVDIKTDCIVWANSKTGFGHFFYNLIRVDERTITDYPELFEVEKVGRVFEDGAWYKAKHSKWSEWEVIRFYDGYGFMRLGLMGYEIRESFYEIGERIAL